MAQSETTLPPVAARLADVLAEQLVIPAQRPTEHWSDGMKTSAARSLLKPAAENFIDYEQATFVKPLMRSLPRLISELGNPSIAPTARILLDVLHGRLNEDSQEATLCLSKIVRTLGASFSGSGGSYLLPAICSFQYESAVPAFVPGATVAQLTGSDFTSELSQPAVALAASDCRTGRFCNHGSTRRRSQPDAGGH